MKTTLLGLLSLVLFLASCGQKVTTLEDSNVISTLGSYKAKELPGGGLREEYISTTAGNLITTALKEEHRLDIALYPRDLINEENIAFLNQNLSERDITNILSLYPNTGNQDEFFLGFMKGRDIRELLRTRIQDTFNLDIEVAGLNYSVTSEAGVITGEAYNLVDGRNFDDDESYRVAINIHFFFSGETFPSYKFRNGLNFSFIPTGVIVSAKETLRNYLTSNKAMPSIGEARGVFTKTRLGHTGFKRTFEIQGNAHRSPYWRRRVTTRGVVTAIDNVDWYPRGIDVVIQDQEGDGVDETSDALHLHFIEDTTNLKMGDLIEVEGTVFEHMTLDQTQNMSKTVLRDINQATIKILERNVALPAPVLIGSEGREIPNKVLSTWVGDLNFKPGLVLTDGIDFWESLEGMRVTIKDPRVAGFRGGQEELVRRNPQRHLSLYIVPDGFTRKETRTLSGGQMEDYMVGDFSPEVIQMSAGNLTADFNRLSPTRPRSIDECEMRGGFIYKSGDTTRCQVPSGLMSPEYHYNVGDTFKGKITGIISFESNLFGGGEYTFVLPSPVYRYDENVNNGPEATCLVRSIEYLNPEYINVLGKDITEASCGDILSTRNDIIKKSDESSFQEVLGTLSRSSFTNGNTINCLDADFFDKSMPFECRPQVDFEMGRRKLTVAALNLENLAGNQPVRIQSIGDAIRHNLKCPDIMTLVEVQDDNGLDFQGDSSADQTLEKIIKATNCAQDGVTYLPVNIDPLNHNEGGQPGGNIRVAILYNSKRVGFTAWGENDPTPFNRRSLQETSVTKEGNLSNNPGRVYPNSDAFKNTRKSIIAQFDFFGEKVFVIGNHFNSKLGDSSFWGAIQPPFPKSDERRLRLANALSDFIQMIEQREPEANIVVLGDFNAHYNERSMRALEGGGILTNLMFHGNLVHPNDRYSHNYNGSSSAIDFIFANRRLMARGADFNVLHINSDYMGRLSDHDPVIAQFNFPAKSQGEKLKEHLNLPLIEVAEEISVKISDYKLLTKLLESEDNYLSLSEGKVFNKLLFGDQVNEMKKEGGFCTIHLTEGNLPQQGAQFTISSFSEEWQLLNGFYNAGLKLESSSNTLLSVDCNLKDLNGDIETNWKDFQDLLMGTLNL